MTTWTRVSILEQSRSWVSPWRPPGSTHVTVDGYEFYVLGSEATLMSDPTDDVHGAIAAAARCGADSCQITVGPDYPEGDAAMEVLATVPAVALGITDILARDPSVVPAEILPAPDVEVREVRTYEQVADFERASAVGWGYPPPSDASIDAAHRKLVPGSFLAQCRGVPAGTGGFTLVGPVARFWGAAVVPAFRRRGVYQALVASRLVDAAGRGATLALVHAAPTSSPLLQRLGFVKVGERCTFRVHLGRD